MDCRAQENVDTGAIWQMPRAENGSREARTTGVRRSCAESNKLN